MAGGAERALNKIGGDNLDGAWIVVSFAGDLAEQPIAAATGFGQHYRRAQLGLAQIGKWKMDDYDVPGCK